MKIDIEQMVGENVKRMRLEREWSGIYLAELMGTTPQNISGIEHGTRGLSVKQIGKICESFGCQPADLFAIPEKVNGDLIKRQLMAEIRIMSREDLAALCASAVSLNAAKGVKP